MKRLLILLASALAGSAAAAAATPQLAQATARPKAAAQTTTPLAGFGAKSKEPINVEAKRLEVIDKEQRAIYSGDVVVVQGQTTLRCVRLVVHYDQKATQGASGGRAPANSSPQGALKKLDCEGPMSVLSGTQTATAERGVYDAGEERLTLTGKVVISDGENVQLGERAVYDVRTGIATMDAGPTGRVRALIVPGAAPKGEPKGDNKAPEKKGADRSARAN